MRYGVQYAGPRRGRRGQWTGMAMLALLALAVLVPMVLAVWRWLCWLLGAAAAGVSSFILQPSSLPLAMAPVPQGAALLVVLVVAGLLIGWSVVAERRVNARRSEEWDREMLAARKAREARERVWREARAKARRVERWSMGPLESLSEAFEEEETLRGGDFERDRLAACFTDEDRLAACFTDEVRVLKLGLQDVREIVGASRSESQAVLELIEAAQRTLSVDDYGDALAGAHGRLAQVVRTLGDLRRALEPQQEGAA